MQDKGSRFSPQIKKPIAGWRAFLVCILAWLVGSPAASELTASSWAGLWWYGTAFLAAAVLVVIGRKRLRIEQYGRLAGRALVFAGDFLLCVAAAAGVFDALGAAAFIALGTNPFQNFLVLTAGAVVTALAAALVLNKIRTDRFLTNLYQISMM